MFGFLKPRIGGEELGAAMFMEAWSFDLEEARGFLPRDGSVSDRTVLAEALCLRLSAAEAACKEVFDDLSLIPANLAVRSALRGLSAIFRDGILSPQDDPLGREAPRLKNVLDVLIAAAPRKDAQIPARMRAVRDAAPEWASILRRVESYEPLFDWRSLPLTANNVGAQFATHVSTFPHPQLSGLGSLVFLAMYRNAVTNLKRYRVIAPDPVRELESIIAAGRKSNLK
jgi:hypothetical protein